MIHSTMIAYITLIIINYCITSGFSRVIVNIVSCFLYSKRFVKTFVRYCTHIYVCNRFQYWKKYFIVCFLLCLYFHYSDNELPQTAISWKIIYAHGNRMTRFTPDEIAKLIYWNIFIKETLLFMLSDFLAWVIYLSDQILLW